MYHETWENEILSFFKQGIQVQEEEEETVSSFLLAQGGDESTMSF